MKSFIALIAILALASAYPSKRTKESVQEYEQHEPKQKYEPKHKHIPILKYEYQQDKDSYQYGYEGENGISAAEHGVVKKLGEKDAPVVVEGYYSYVGDDGKTYTVHYIADEFGFRATGDHLPTPPPVPKEIQASLDKIASQPQEKHEQYEQKEEKHIYYYEPEEKDEKENVYVLSKGYHSY